MQPSEIIPGTIVFGNNKVNCLRMGSGKKLLIAFHGFGNTAEQFTVFLPFIQEEYTIVAVDLPGHGQTEWNDKYMLPKALMAIVQGIKNDFEVEQFSLIGFSLGARVVLTIVGLQPSWIDSVVLLAPDGLQKNFWYYFATANLFGKQIFINVLHHPQIWVKRFQSLKKLHLIDESRFKFVSSKLLNKAVNDQVAFVWPVMSKLLPNASIVKHNIKKYNIKVSIFMGRYDRIFNFKIGNRFVKGLKTAHISILDSGHNVVVSRFIQKIVEESHLVN